MSETACLLGILGTVKFYEIWNGIRFTFFYFLCRFSKVFDQNCSQDEVFENVAQGVIDKYDIYKLCYYIKMWQNFHDTIYFNTINNYHNTMSVAIITPLTIKITTLWKDVENLSCYHTKKCLLDLPCWYLNSTAFTAFDVLMYNSERRCFKTFLGMVARQIFNIFPQFLMPFHTYRKIRTLFGGYRPLTPHQDLHLELLSTSI